MSIISNRLYLLGPPILLLVSFPLAILATITTTLAVSLLTVRVSIVYFELGVALLTAYVFPEPPKPLPKRPPLPSSSPPRTRHRRSSSSSQDTAVPAARIHTKSGSSTSLLGIGDATRDFEGVGGWRFYEGEGDEALWMNMNKRLELPIAVPRRHQRRHTGEEQRFSWSPELLRMSPVQSRSRTPLAGQDAEGDDYFFPQQGLRPLSTASEPLSASAHHSRRASTSGSSSSSNNGNGSASNSRRTSIVIRQPAE